VTASPRRWVTPNGARLDLAHLTHTTGRLDPTLRSGGSLDGYCLTATHPTSGCVLSETYLGATVPEAALTAALAAVAAYEVTGLPRPRPDCWHGYGCTLTTHNGEDDPR
jgi:hypothetical protein